MRTLMLVALALGFVGLWLGKPWRLFKARRPVITDRYIGIDQHRQARADELRDWHASHPLSLRTKASKGFAKRVQGGGEAA